VTQAFLGLRIAICVFWLTAAAVATAAPVELDPNPDALVQAMQGHRVVLLGEVHDNPVQHALRAAALRQWVVEGARPAIAFEQFERERQPDIERARRERPADADYLIAQAKGRDDWRWEYYRPFVALALEYNLPIVAANLSRREAMQVGIDGWPALFGPATRSALRLDALPTDFRRKHEEAIAIGHCNLLPADALPVLARRDIGVPFWLPADAARGAISIGVLEHDDGSVPESAADFDAYVITERAVRGDLCKELAKRLQPATAR
jgi:hypothetical protein